jgi:hypothetical protein
MTSNIGAELIRKGTTLGFIAHSDEVKSREEDYERMKEKLLGELKKTFRPEFLNRIDGVVVFHPLTKEHIRRIVDLMLALVAKQLAEKGIKLEVTDAAKDFLGVKGYDEVFGARPLRRVIQDMVEDKLSDAVLRGEFKVFDRVFEIKATIEKPEAIAGTIKAAEQIPGILGMESTGDSLTIFSTKSIKFEIENIIKDQVKEAAKGEPEDKRRDKDTPEHRVTENNYVSYVVIDIKDNEIAIESKDNFVVPNLAAVGALAGEDKT